MDKTWGLCSSKKTSCRSLFVTLSYQLILFLFIGCTTIPGPYKPGNPIETPHTLTIKHPYSQIEQGNPVPLLDKFGHYFVSLPSKLLLWNWKVDNHDISPETEAALQDYLRVNNLKNVKVRLNQYAPGGEWRRLFQNKEVGAGWRYSLGFLSVIYYTVFPGRFFAGCLTGDNYNPYTNTINLYSNLPVIAYHEAAHAKDLSEVEWKGTYAATRILPFVSLYHEYIASRDAIRYTYYKGNLEEEQEAYKILYPAFGTYIGDETVDFIGWFYPLTLGQTYFIEIVVVIGGHIVGRTHAILRKEKDSKQ